jgi:hypothetical protein
MTATRRRSTPRRSPVIIVRRVTSGADDLHCPECGYSLRGIDDSSRCPECGQPLDRARLSASNIPWTSRRELGRCRAYWRTLWLVIRHPSRVAADVARPVSFDDAQRFRRATVLVAMAGLLPLLAWACIVIVRARPITMSSTASPTVRIGWLLELLLIPVVIVALYAFLLAAAGVASYFFHPKRLSVEAQNRAVAVSYYACAPLAMMPLSVAVIVVVMLFQPVWRHANVVSLAIVVVAAAVPVGQVVASVAAPLVMLRRATRCSVAGVMLMAAALPVLWALLAVVIAIGIPAAYLFVAVIIMSLIA